MRTQILKIDEYLEKGSKSVLVACIFLMLGLSLFSIILRWFQINFMWIDPLVRHLVLLSAFLGGSLASGANKHIAIDVVGLILEKSGKAKQQLLLRKVMNVLVGLVCLWLSYAAYQFVLVEAQYGKVEFLGVHSKYLVAIIPTGFILVAIRSFFACFKTREEF